MNWDYSGPWTTSIFGKKWLLVAVDDFKPWSKAFALKAKTEAGLALKQYSKYVRKMTRTRSDNENTLRKMELAEGP